MTEERTSQLAGEIEFFSHRAVKFLAQLAGGVDFISGMDYSRKPVCGILVGFGILAELGMFACYFEFVCS